MTLGARYKTMTDRQVTEAREHFALRAAKLEEVRHHLDRIVELTGGWEAEPDHLDNGIYSEVASYARALLADTDWWARFNSEVIATDDESVYRQLAEDRAPRCAIQTLRPED